MSYNKIAITKNGYDILRIRETSSDGNNCEFKICPMIKPKDINIYYMQLFSEPKYFEFDKNKELEITYHKANNGKRTKIHLKLKNEFGIEYKDLELTKLVEPNVNTEIPIPLLQIIIPDEVLYKKYEKKKDHTQFEVKNNNIIEIYLTKKGYKDSNLFDKWNKLNFLLFANSIQYYATGLNEKYAGQNLYMKLQEKDIGLINFKTDVTDDIGISINVVNNPNIKTKKMCMLFIENAAYLGFLGGSRLYTKKCKDGKLAYKYDLDNDQYFDSNEKEKWENIFRKEFEKLNEWIYLSDGKYDKQFKNKKE